MFVIVSVAFDHEYRICYVIEYCAQTLGTLVIPMFVIVSFAFDHEDRVYSVIEYSAETPGTLVILIFVIVSVAFDHEDIPLRQPGRLRFRCS